MYTSLDNSLTPDECRSIYGSLESLEACRRVLTSHLKHVDEPRREIKLFEDEPKSVNFSLFR